MKTCSKSPPVLLKLMCIALFSGLEAQKIIVQPEVTAYLGQDVTLQCEIIPGPNNDTITQVQWELKPLEGEKFLIIVSNKNYGVNISNTFLKDRVEIEEQSLIIRDLKITDAGDYTCDIATFPFGPLEANTKLVVKKQMPLSAGVVSAIVIGVLLLSVILAAVAYLIYIKRPVSSVRHRVYIDAGGPVMDMARPSVIIREQDVVYSDVKLKPSREATPSSKDKHTQNENADEVTYSEVRIGRPH